MTCYNGPHPIKVEVKNGIATCVEPNPDGARISPSEGRPCVKAYSMISKLYDPDRVKPPLVRQNPKKGKNEDPMWKEIGWDEALDLLAGKLRNIRENGLVDEASYPRLAITLGGAGTPEGHFGTLPAFLSSWRGPIDMSLGSGQAVKCYHSDHVFGELWHRAFMVVEDLPRTNYILSFGHGTNASDGVGVWKDAAARGKGSRRVQIEPHLSVTGATADRWAPIKPKTDALFLCSMLYVILHEMDWKKLCDIEFIKNMTNSPYLVGPEGYFMRDRETEKPLIWDLSDNRSKVFDDESIKEPAITGVYRIDVIEKGVDDEKWEYSGIESKPSFELLMGIVKDYSPESVAEICGIPAETIRETAREFVENARVGATVEINGKRLPYRPVAVILGKTVNNGPGGYETCWARTVLAMLVGALEVPGGTLGSASKLYPPYQERWGSVKKGVDGFMEQQLNPTEKGQWPPDVMFRGPYTALMPLNGRRGWAGGIAPFTLAWILSDQPRQNWPSPSLPKCG